MRGGHAPSGADSQWNHIRICIADWTAALGDGRSLVTGRGGCSLAASANAVVHAGLACGPVRGPVWPCVWPCVDAGNAGAVGKEEPHEGKRKVGLQQSCPLIGRMCTCMPRSAGLQHRICGRVSAVPLLLLDSVGCPLALFHAFLPPYQQHSVQLCSKPLSRQLLASAPIVSHGQSRATTSPIDAVCGPRPLDPRGS